MKKEKTPNRDIRAKQKENVALAVDAPKKVTFISFDNAFIDNINDIANNIVLEKERLERDSEPFVRKIYNLLTR